MRQSRGSQRTVGVLAGCVTTLCLAFLCVGCETPPAETVIDKQRGEAPAVTPAVPAARVWQPAPVRVRVYPSTRFIQESGRAILEARFELFDEMGDPVKSAGKFQVELYSIDENLGSVPQRLLYTWNAQTLTLADQREHYDPITRGYLFRLGVDNLKIAKQATLLKVTFTPAGRPRLEAESVVRPEW